MRAKFTENQAADTGGGLNNEEGGVVEIEKSEIEDNVPNNCSGNVPDCNSH
ncbi:hypothetical protein [Streptomyces sp. NPDC051211]|uniref:hypothetical protein n=1 Tax=Streptomyces sp. NPDC051211 TaxID=3154643 RepID=UPI00344E3FA2